MIEGQVFCFSAEALVFVSATTSRPVKGFTHPRKQRIPVATWLRILRILRIQWL